jgi:tetratricopeptide (TPR) repeat protein
MILKNYSGAITDFNKFIDINPNECLIYYKRGEAQMMLGHKQNACMDWRKAGELGCEDVYDDIKNYCN